jgi:hypothetical protein
MDIKILEVRVIEAPFQISGRNLMKVQPTHKGADALERVWLPQNYDFSQAPSVGDLIEIGICKDGLLHYIEKEPPATSRKAEISNYIRDHIQLWNACYTRAGQIEGLPSGDRRAVATTVYLRTVEKFDL